MTLRDYIVSLIVCSLLILFFACRTSPKLSFDVPALDTTIHPTKISLSDLAKDYKAYNGKYIETEGTFHSHFEQFAVFTDKKFLTSKTQAFWLDLNRKLQIPEEAFGKMNGQQIRIKGKIDMTRKGHLGQYIATIDNIYYWHQE